MIMERENDRILQKVMVVLAEEPSESAQIERFRKRLQGEQITSALFLLKNGSKKAVVEEIWREIGNASAGGVLCISSVSDICNAFLEKGHPVIAYLGGKHKGSFAGVSYAIESFENVDSLYLERVCRRYAGLPWDILETKRCKVRETTVEDVDVFYEIYAQPSITQYMENLFPERQQEIEYTKGYIQNVYRFYEYGLWTVLDKDSGKVIGRAGVSWREDTENVEIGYVVAVPYQRQGYAYEVCSGILQYAEEELGIEEVCAYIKSENKASKGLSKKLGFVCRGEVCVGEEWFEKWVKVPGKF